MEEKELFVSLKNIIPKKFLGERYEISNFGNVRHVGSTTYRQKHITPNGYAVVAIKDINRNTRQFYIHRLVALAFLGEISDNDEVDHIDRNKLNNKSINLRIISHKENSNNKGDRNSKYIIRVYDIENNFVCQYPFYNFKSKFQMNYKRILEAISKHNGFYKGFKYELIRSDYLIYINKYGAPDKNSWKESIRFPGVFVNTNGLLYIPLKNPSNLSKMYPGVVKGNYFTFRNINAQRIVYETFVEEKLLDKNFQIDHINGDTFDNRIINLRKVTVKENMENKNTKKLLQERCPNKKEILSINILSENTIKFPSINEAARFLKINPSTIGRCINGESLSAKNYIFGESNSDLLIHKRKYEEYLDSLLIFIYSLKDNKIYLLSSGKEFKSIPGIKRKDLYKTGIINNNYISAKSLQQLKIKCNKYLNLDLNINNNLFNCIGTFYKGQLFKII